MWYNINFNKWATLLLPTYLRKPKMLAFLKVLVKPVSDLHEEFLIQRKRDAVYLSHNSQVCYLRKVLNDEFDATNRTIEIVDGNKFNRSYIYTRIDDKTPFYLGKMSLNSRDDYSDTGVDYMVKVPSNTLATKEIDMKAFINRFNAATKRYKLIEL